MFFVLTKKMAGQIERIEETLLYPDIIVQSKTDQNIELFYQYYKTTPVTEKYLCVVVKSIEKNTFIITA